MDSLRMKRLLIWILMFVVGTALTAQNKTLKEQIALLYTEADLFLSEGDTDNACLSLEKLLRLDKSNRSNLYLALGGIAEQKQKTNQAQNYYKKSISADKKSDKAYYSMGALFYNQAIEILESIPSDEQTQHVTETRQALIYLKKALPFLEQGFRLSGDKDIYQKPLNAVYQYLNLDKRIE